MDKLKFVVKLPEKIDIFRKFFWRNQNVLTRIHDSPDFKPDWRRWSKEPA